MFVVNSMVDWPSQFYAWVDSSYTVPIKNNHIILYLIILIIFIFICRYFMFGMISGSLFLNFKVSHRQI